MKSLDLNEVNLQLQLPQELIDHIVDILSAQESWQALAQCLLVSRSFFVRARRHLFSKISTRESMFPSPSRGETDKIDGVLEILQKDPLRDCDPLALHVRSLKVPMFPVSDIHSGPVTRRPNEWNAQRQNLRDVLERLPNLHTFGLQFTALMDWNSIQTWIQHWNTAPYALSVTKYGWGAHPIRIQRHHSKWHPKSLQKLQHIETKCAGDVFVDIMLAKRNKLLASPLSQLRSLTLIISRGPFVHEWEAMKCAVLSLKRLTISGLISSDVTNIFPGPICLSVFTSLRTLVLCINVTLHRLQVSPVNLAFVLRQISEPTTIENVIVNFQATLYFTFHTEDQFYSVERSTTWSTIDNALTGPSFPSLEKVHFDFKWQYYGNKSSVDGDGDNQQSSSSTSAEEPDREHCKRSQKQREGILARLARKTEAALPKLADSHRIECTYNNQS